MTETTKGGIVYKAKSSKKVKTGTWRTFKPIVDKEKCIKCGKCEKYCPDMAIKVKKDGAEPDLDYCKGCGICAEECPVDAIEMEEEEK